MRSTMTRRTALAVSAAATTVSALRARPVRAAEKSDVIVLGGGLSGLKAAMMLKELGASVTVLEGNSRVGGRAFTGDGVFGRPEFGASQVGPYYARVRDTCAQLGVELGPGANINAPFTFSIQGQLIRAEEWEGHALNKTVGPERRVPPSALQSFYMNANNPFTELDQWLEPEAAQYDIPMGDWLIEKGASPAALELINTGLIAPDIWNVSLLTLLQEATRGRMMSGPAAPTGNKDRFEQAAMTSSHIVGGTSRLPEAIAAFIGDGVHLNAQAAMISMADTGCEVTTLDGRRFASDFIISALPFGPLRRITIDPPLQGMQAEAVRSMPYANNTQVHFRILKPYWEEDGLEASLWTDGPINMFRQSIGYDGSRDKAMALSVGKKGERLDQLPPADRAAFVMAEVERLRPSTKGKLEVTAVHSWPQYDWVAGCRHSYGPGQVSRWAHDMIKPHGRMHFAGEHTRRLEIGMESAMESGERAAFEVLERMS